LETPLNHATSCLTGLEEGQYNALILGNTASRPQIQVTDVSQNGSSSCACLKFLFAMTLAHHPLKVCCLALCVAPSHQQSAVRVLRFHPLLQSRSWLCFHATSSKRLLAAIGLHRTLR